MFNRKELLQLRAENKRLSDLLKYKENEEKQLLEKLTSLEGTAKVLNIDAISFARSLQRFTKRKSCGMGGCGFVYYIPSHVIDNVARNFKTTRKP